MRISVVIADGVLAAAEVAARRRGWTLDRLVESALRHELAAQDSDRAPQVPIFRGGGGPKPGLDLRSNRALAESLGS